MTHQEALGVLHVLYLAAGLLATSIVLAASLMAAVGFAVHQWRLVSATRNDLRALAKWIRGHTPEPLAEEEVAKLSGEARAWAMSEATNYDIATKIELVADGKAWA